MTKVFFTNNFQISQSMPTPFRLFWTSPMHPFRWSRNFSHANSPHSHQQWIVLVNLKLCFNISLYFKVKLFHHPISPSWYHISSVENISKHSLSHFPIPYQFTLAEFPYHQAIKTDLIFPDLPVMSELKWVIYSCNIVFSWL